MKVWDRAGIELATPGSAVRLASVARHVTDCATRPGYSFNCDGCLRVLPKLTEMASKLNNQSKRYDECNQKIKDLEGSIDEKIEKQVDKAIESYRNREDRKCNVIFHNIPESFCENKKEEDGRKLRDVLAVMKCDDIEPKAFVRLGRPHDGKQRLLKVILTQ